MPDNPDENQNEVKWIPLQNLDHITLFPNMKKHIIDYVNNQNGLNIIEEHLLAPQ